MRFLFNHLQYQLIYDLHARYMGSLIGVYWSIVTPALQVIIYVLLFSVIFQAKLGGVSSPYEYALFCLAGLGAWSAFSEAITTSASSITRNAAIIKNIAFPSVLFPASSVLCSFVTMGTTYSALIVLRALDGYWPGWSIFALPLVLITHALLVFGLGLYLAVIGTFFRDILQILPVILQFLMLITPVIYLKSDVPGSLQLMTTYNPLYYLIESYRQIFYFGAWPEWFGLSITALIGLALVFSGLKLFGFARGYFEAVV